MFQVSFERGEGDALIGGPPSPEQDSNENVISVFVSKVVDPVNPFGTSVSTIHLIIIIIITLLISSKRLFSLIYNVKYLKLSFPKISLKNAVLF